MNDITMGSLSEGYPYRYKSGEVEAVSAVKLHIRDIDFPCVAAKSALAANHIETVVGDDLQTGTSDKVILAALQNFATRPSAEVMMAFVAVFPKTSLLSEILFEKYMWQWLYRLHVADRREHQWDPNVSSDPASPNFGMSFGGKGFFIIGLHPNASRLSRRAPMAMIAFNPHAQLKRLKAVGKYDRLRQVIRIRDTTLQGHINPMLSDHGINSEASQYSGRAVPKGWSCPYFAEL